MGKYMVVLKEGFSFRTPWGETFRRGIKTPISDNRIDYFRTSGRFELLEAVEVRRADDTAEEPPKPRPRPRAETRQRRASTEEKTSGVSDERKLTLAKIDVSTKLKRTPLERIAMELGATGPDGELPKDAKNKDDLVDWIARRQSEVLAEMSAQTEDPENE